MLFEDEPTHDCLMWVLRRILSRRKVEGENEERKSERERERNVQKAKTDYKKKKVRTNKQLISS